MAFAWAPAELAYRPGRTQKHLKDMDPTPKAQHGAWSFEASLLDPNFFAFSAFANQIPGAGENALYHSQAGDLHTSGMGIDMCVGTPLSMQMSEAGVHPAQVYLQQPYPQPALPPQSFQNNHTGYPPTTAQEQKQQSYAPATCMHHDTGYDGSPMQDSSRMGQMDDATMQPPMMTSQPRQFEINAFPPLPVSAKYRFHVVLNAPTAIRD